MLATTTPLIFGSIDTGLLFGYLLVPFIGLWIYLLLRMFGIFKV